MAMLKAVEMKLITDTSPTVVVDQVNRLLAQDSWTLHGDFKIVASTSGLVYSQVMVKLQPMEFPGSSLVGGGGPPIMIPRG
jgi:hypothetical protein